MPLFDPAAHGGSRSSKVAGHGCLTSVLTLVVIVLLAVIIAVVVLVHDDHAADAPLPRTDYSISVSCCTTNQFGQTVAVGTLHRLLDRGDYNLQVVGLYFNAETGQIVGEGGYSVWAPSIGSRSTLQVTSAVNLPEVPIRATITLRWDNPQPFNLTF